MVVKAAHHITRTELTSMEDLYTAAPVWETLPQHPVSHHQTQGQFHPTGHKTTELLSYLAHHYDTLELATLYQTTSG